MYYAISNNQLKNKLKVQKKHVRYYNIDKRYQLI